MGRGRGASDCDKLCEVVRRMGKGWKERVGTDKGGGRVWVAGGRQRSFLNKFLAFLGKRRIEI